MTIYLVRLINYHGNQMTDVTLITPPDKLFNTAYNILLINPSAEVRQGVSDILQKVSKEVNLYLFDDNNSSDIEWLLETMVQSQITILDLDNSGSLVRNFASYIMSNTKTFYLTNDQLTPYNLISANRIYDVYWLQEILNEE